MTTAPRPVAASARPRRPARGDPRRGAAPLRRAAVRRGLHQRARPRGRRRPRPAQPLLRHQARALPRGAAALLTIPEEAATDLPGHTRAERAGGRRRLVPRHRRRRAGACGSRSASAVRAGTPRSTRSSRRRTRPRPTGCSPHSSPGATRPPIPWPTRCCAPACAPSSAWCAPRRASGSCVARSTATASATCSSPPWWHSCPPPLPGGPMTGPTPSATAPLDLGDRDFWSAPWPDRYATFAALRARDDFPMYPEPEFPGFEPGPGFRVADPARGRRGGQPQPRPLLLGPRGGVDPRPARRGARVLRLADQHGRPPPHQDPSHRGRGVHPEADHGLVDDVERIAGEVLARARATAAEHDGEFDLVTEIAAPLPLLLICDMMGIPESRRAGRLHLVEHDPRRGRPGVRLGQPAAGLPHRGRRPLRA